MSGLSPEEASDKLIRVLAIVKEVLRERGQYDAIQTELDAINDQLLQHLEKDHGLIGKVLKAHLIVEHHITQRLKKEYQGTDIEKVRLRFIQKVDLLPKEDTWVAIFTPGIIELNKLRNKLAHHIDADLGIALMPEIGRILRLFEGTLEESVEEWLQEFAIRSAAVQGFSKEARRFGMAAQHEALVRMGLGHESK